jgi:hypothetical protein
MRRIIMTAKSSRILFLSLLACLALSWLDPGLPARAADAWKVLFNGQPSSMKIQEVGEGQKMVTVSFPVPAEGRHQDYGVRVETDPVAMAVKITKVEKKKKTRDPGDCPVCKGSKKCQDCWPAGSGVNTGGVECIGCNGTGLCNYCHGSGVCYTCDGKGMSTGCSTCGKVSVP